MELTAHWDDRYRTIGTRDVSWFQSRPSVSLGLLDELAVGTDDSVIDVGGGASVLVDALVDRGHRDVTVLDLSAHALDVARARLDAPDAVEWIATDLLVWRPGRRRDVWHDRAVAHFLTGEADRSTYRDVLRATLAPGGAFVIGTFAEDGPTECSGLPVQRFMPDELVDLVTRPDETTAVEVVATHREVHRTPNGHAQPFNWIAGRLHGHVD